MKAKLEYLTTRFLGLALAIGAVLYLTLPVLAIGWAQKPFIGFLIDPNLVVNERNLIDNNGNLLPRPMHYPQRLISVNEVPVRSLAELQERLADYTFGDTLSLTFIRPENSVVQDSPAGATVTYPITLTQFSSLNLWTLFWRFYLVGLLTLIIGLAVFMARPEQTPARVFAFFTLSVAWSIGGVFDSTTNHQFIRFWLVALPFAGSLHALLIMVFPHEFRLVRNYPNARWLVLIPAVIICVWAQQWLYRPDDPWAYVVPWRNAFYLNGFVLILGLLMLAYRAFASKSPLVRQQGLLILLAAAISFGPFIIWTFNFSTSILQIAMLLLGVYPLAVGYAIIRYRLLNIQIVFRQVVTYGLLFIAYALVVVIFGLILGPFITPNDPLLLIVFALFVVITFDRGRAYVRKVVEQTFIRQEVEYDRLLVNYNRTLTESLTTDQVASNLLQTVKTGVPNSDVELYLADTQRTTYSSYHNNGLVLAADEPLIKVLGRDPGVISLADERVWPAELRQYRDLVLNLKAVALVPLISNKQLLGWLSLSGRNINEPEFRFLNAIADQSLIALERADVIRRLETQIAELGMLSQFSQALNFTIEFDDLLELVYTHCQRLLTINDFAIFLRRPGISYLFPVFWVEDGERIREKEQQKQPTIDPHLTQVATTGQQLVTITNNGRAWMGAPLNAGADTLGVLQAVASRPGQTFRQRQQQLFGVFADRAATALDRWLVNERLSQRAQQLQSLSQMTRSLSAIMELDKMLELILDKALELLEAEAGSFLMMDDDTGELEFRVVRGPTSQNLLGRRLPLGTGLAGTAAQTGRPLLVNDVRDDERWFKGLDTPEFATHSSLTIPLIRHHQVLGVLQVINRLNGLPFSEEDQTLLTAFAGQAVVALETARLVQQTDNALQSRVNELSLLQQFDRDLSTTLDLDHIVNLTLDWTLRICDGTAGAIVLIEEDNSPKIRATRGYDASFEPHQLGPETLEAGIVGYVLKNSKPHLTNHVQQEERYIAAAFDTKCQITVPIMHKQKPIGAIAIESSRPNAFGNLELDSAGRVASRAGATIANAILYQQIIEANQAKSALAAAVSHELNNPMTSIIGYTNFLQKEEQFGPLNNQQRAFLHTITKNAARMERLIRDLSDFSRVDRGLLKVEARPTAFPTVISEALESLQENFISKEIQVNLDIPADLPLVLGDKQRLVQVLINLLSNAFKYSPEGAQLFVVLQPLSGDEKGLDPSRPVILCSVRDTGYGMSESDLAKVFNKSFRADDPNIRKAPGTGLGLMITKGLVELHGGRIWVESKLGYGTTFSFTIPQV